MTSQRVIRLKIWRPFVTEAVSSQATEQSEKLDKELKSLDEMEEQADSRWVDTKGLWLWEDVSSVAPTAACCHQKCKCLNKARKSLNNVIHIKPLKTIQTWDKSAVQVKWWFKHLAAVSFRSLQRSVKSELTDAELKHWSSALWEIQPVISDWSLIDWWSDDQCI